VADGDRAQSPAGEVEAQGSQAGEAAETEAHGNQRVGSQGRCHCRWGWRWREKILGLVDQLLLLLLEIAEPVFGATPAILALLARRRCWARLHIKLE
jgi:hypothetical protein